MKPKSLKLWLPILAVSLLLVWVSREVQYRHRYVENMEADKLLSQSEKDELITYYGSLNTDKPGDPTKLSNKAKLLMNSITDHPLTAVTDNVVTKIIFLQNQHPNSKDIPASAKEQMTPANVKSKLINNVILGVILPLIFEYQTIYLKSTNEPSRSEFETDISNIISNAMPLMIGLGIIKANIDSFNGKKDPKNPFVQLDYMGPVLIDLFGTTPLIEIPSVAGSNPKPMIDLSGPLQRNIVDNVYQYFYPTPDFFTWLKRLIFG